MKLLADNPPIALNQTSFVMKNSCVSKKLPDPGKIKTCTLAQYHLYVPKKGGWGAPVLIAVHGISHRAKQQARAFKDMAERYGIVILAPLFSRQSFPAYQRLGVSKKNVPLLPDQILNAMIEEVGNKTGARTERFFYLVSQQGVSLSTAMPCCILKKFMQWLWAPLVGIHSPILNYLFLEDCV